MNTPANDTKAGSGPLSGLRVLDLTIAMAGPMCTQRLGEMGAEVIKIEAPGGGDFSRHAPMAGVTRFGDSICYLTLNRNKKSLVMNLKSEEGQKVLSRLVETADVLVQNFRPRAARKLGLDYGSLSRINPRLIYGSISGYGNDGPMKDRPGQDLLLQSFSGLTMNGGQRGGLPQASPLYMVDVTASHLLGEGVLAALVERSLTGRGQEVAVSMLGAIMEMQCQEITSFVAAEQPPERGETPQVSIYQEPPYGIYECAEGFLAIAQTDLDVLAAELDRPILADLNSKRPNGEAGPQVAAWRDEIHHHVATRLRDKPAPDWDAQLATAGVWCMVVQDYESFLKHPQVIDHLVQLDHPVGGAYTAVAPAITFSGTSRPDLANAPAYGADTDRVLTSLGYSDVEVEALRTAGVVVSTS